MRRTLPVDNPESFLHILHVLIPVPDIQDPELIVIEDEEIIRKILKHLGLWEVKPRPPPRAIGPPKTPEYSIDYSVSQLPEFTRRSCGGSDKWLYVHPEYPEDAYPA